ncbi:hypothetical protein SQ03_11320, partial [Methylobacterium platani JCM 14648]
MSAALVAGCLATLTGSPVMAQLNPIVAATQVPGVPGAPLSPYGAPYGYGGYYPPYQTQNPGLTALTQGQNNPNIASRAGATQMPGLLAMLGL